MTFIGIDQGTTGTCALRATPDGHIVAQAYRAHTQHRPRTGWVEHDPIEIWHNIQAVLHEVLAAPGPPPRAIGLANQGETCMAWRRDTGEPLSRALVWQDQRTHADMVALARDTTLAERVLHTTGLPLDAYPSASKLQWLLEHTPGARALAEQRLLCLGTLDAWILRKLAGTSHTHDITDASTAARTQLFDLHTRAFTPWLLDLFELEPHMLPIVTPSTAPIHTPLITLTNHKHLPLTASVVDQPAALFGHGCLDAGMTKATYGTGCFAYMHAGDTPPTPAGGLLSTLVWQHHDGTPAYALDGGVFSVGSDLGWTTQLGLLPDPTQLDTLLAHTPHSHGVVCVPALAGLACPYWSRETRAALFGMSLDTTREHILFALLEGLALRVTQVVRTMERSAHTQLDALRVDGGLTRSHTLMQLQADLLQTPVEVAATPETTALGVALMAAHGAGELSDDDIRAQTRSATTRFEPRIPADQAEARLARFEHAVQLARQWSE